MEYLPHMAHYMKYAEKYNCWKYSLKHRSTRSPTLMKTCPLFCHPGKFPQHF